MPRSCWINSQFVDEDVASISVRDAGLLHGAGVFTTLRARGGAPLLLDRHLARLRQSCDALFVPLQHKDAVLQEATAELLQRNELPDARIRITVTRGQVSQDPLHGMRVEPNVLITAAPFEAYPREYYERGMTVIVHEQWKLNPYDLQAGHKTLNYFTRLAALRQAGQIGAGEALLFNVHNYLQSGSISNVFLIRGGELRTPPTRDDQRDGRLLQSHPLSQSAVLPGVTRGLVLELAAESGIPAQSAPLTINDLLDAEEVFLTNSVMRVMPVARIERRAIGADKPGPITLALAQKLKERLGE